MPSRLGASKASCELHLLSHFPLAAFSFLKREMQLLVFFKVRNLPWGKSPTVIPHPA